MTIKCTLCGSEKLPTICQFHDEYMPLCCDCVGFSWPQIVARLYDRVKDLESALRMIKGNSQYCDSCSASMFADEALGTQIGGRREVSNTLQA